MRDVLSTSPLIFVYLLADLQSFALGFFNTAAGKTFCFPATVSWATFSPNEVSLSARVG
jgi:hypothetical protein